MINIKNNLTFLKLLSTSNKATIHALLNSAKNDQLYAIFECMHNLLLGNVKIGHDKLLNLKKYKTEIRKLANKKISIKEKMKIMLKKYSLFKNILPVIFKKLDDETRKENDNGSLHTTKTR